jgi:hypothetical protein
MIVAVSLRAQIAKKLIYEQGINRFLIFMKKCGTRKIKSAICAVTQFKNPCSLIVNQFFNSRIVTKIYL